MKLLKHFTAFSAGIILTFSTNKSLAQSDFWQRINGPSLITSLAVNSSGHVFAGTLGYGMFRTLDNGNNWTAINNGLTTIAILSLAINSSDHFFAGTHGSGVFRSLDNGDTWYDVDNNLLIYFIYDLDFNARGHIFSGTHGLGVFRSLDNGDNWTAINNGVTNTYIHSLGVNSSGHVFAGTMNGQIYRTQNNGDNWTDVSSSLITGDVRCLTINSNGDVFAGTDNGLFRSSDNGVHWSAINGNSFRGVSDIAINSDGQVFAVASGVYRSLDNGNSWTPVNSGLVSASVVSLTIDSRGYIYAGTTDGVYRSFQTTTSVGETENDGKSPSSFAVSQNYPNPFNPSTKIAFALPSAQNVTLKVFTLAGQEVATLLNNERKPAGNHELTFDAGNLPSGVYFYRLQAADFVETRKMLLVR